MLTNSLIPECARVRSRHPPELALKKLPVLGGLSPMLLAMALAGCGGDSPVSPGATPTPTPTPTPSPRADIIFFNGQVITIELDRPTADALAVLGEDILLVGSNQEVSALARTGNSNHRSRRTGTPSRLC